jgi:hypothetical protein
MNPLLQVFIVLAIPGAALGALRAVLAVRARAMRSLATRWGLHYKGPAAPKLLGFGRWRRVPPALPASFPRDCYRLGEILQAWNIIEGNHNRTPIVICDTAVGWRSYCTIVGCQTEANPFAGHDAPDRVVRSGGWRVLYRLRYLQIPWTMSISELDRHIGKLVG